jgi:glucose/arabinose dehydrogenase
MFWFKLRDISQLPNTYIIFMRQLFAKSKTMPYKAIYISLCLCMISLFACAGDGGHGPGKRAIRNAAADTAVKVPAGFKAEIIADGLGRARHLAVAGNGAIFVKLEKLKNNGGIYRLQDNDHDGKMDVYTGFGNYPGTGMAIRKGYLYASSDEEIFRYKLDANDNVVSPNDPEKIVTGLIKRGEHEAKAFTLDYDGNIYVNIGAYSNACQVVDRTEGSPGIKPCPILDSAAGIWEFKADKPNQTYGDGVHYATGLRNVVGLDWNTATNSLFVMQHGRDQLHELYASMYSQEQGNELPAECMYELHKGSNGGWPYIYYDELQHKKILCPEYGGDGKKTAGEDAQDPVVAFPGHMAPNGLLFYTGKQFPEKYRNGAFIAFHGSWNRQPQEKGYFVAFVPFKDGKPSGDWEVFADNFAGTKDISSPNKAKHRPCGLAQGPDGSIYVSDDVKGTIWKISYRK